MAGVDARDAEVQDLRLARAEDHDVGRLDVPVDDAELVGVVQGLGDAARDAQRLTPRKTAARREAIGQGLSVEVLEGHEKEAAPGVAAHVVHDDDPGVGEARRGARLGLEAPLVRLALGRGQGEGADHLQGDGPAEGRIPRLVHQSHRPAAELPPDLVPPDRARSVVSSHGDEHSTGRRSLTA